MADISAFTSGDVNDSGKVNWRGDQATAPVGQSIYKTSTVKLADLGARVVVGDRSFRYALAGGAVVGGDFVGKLGVAANGIDTPASTAAGLSYKGDKRFSYSATLSRAADFYADGYLCQQTWTEGHGGTVYGIKTHTNLAATTAAQYLILHDPLVTDVVTSAVGLWYAVENQYSRVVAASGVHAIAGVAVISATSGDYFWVQTWGPSNVRAGVVTAVGAALTVGLTGACNVALNSSGNTPISAVVGHSMQIMTASTRGLIFVTLAP